MSTSTMSFETTCRGTGAPDVFSLAMTVGDLEQSVAFYRDVLDFDCLGEDELSGPEFERLTNLPQARAQVARMRLGTEIIELIQFITPRGRLFPPDSRGNDQWFQHAAIVVPDMAEAYDRLLYAHVEHASVAPQRLPDWNESAGGIHAFYFRDPDGHFLELLQFPPGKGSSRWQESTEETFLGLDHTAIVVSSTERSLEFYRDHLGLRVEGTSLNYGPEQERLSGVPAAKVRITSLRGASGPGIELLEYLQPRNGKQRPSDSHPNDLLNWHTAIRRAGSCEKGLVHDPDGHVVEWTGSKGPGL
jgi:catechol 2,3-dioxygenase-like lactoylglutathione lyase family enzyme